MLARPGSVPSLPAAVHVLCATTLVSRERRLFRFGALHHRVDLQVQRRKRFVERRRRERGSARDCFVEPHRHARGTARDRSGVKVPDVVNADAGPRGPLAVDDFVTARLDPRASTPEPKMPRRHAEMHEPAGVAEPARVRPRVDTTAVFFHNMHIHRESRLVCVSCNMQLRAFDL